MPFAVMSELKQKNHRQNSEAVWNCNRQIPVAYAQHCSRTSTGDRGGNQVKQILHVAKGQAVPALWNGLFEEKLREIGELTMVENCESLSEAEIADLIRGCNILVVGWGAVRVPVQIAHNPGKLEYICNLTGETRPFVPIEVIESGVPVTNWGAGNENVAEGAMALLLACLKDLHSQILEVRSGGWRLDERFFGGSLEELNVGVYGLGFIGRRFVELLRPFRPVIRIFDPYAAQIPDDCIRSETLEDLFGNCEAVAVHAALTDETRKSVTAELLAKLPRHGILVNTARGGIIDQDALFAELESGRLRAGLDVLDPDYLPEDHPARQWPNLILTAHTIERRWPDDGLPARKLNRFQEIGLANIRRFLAGQPLQFVMDRERYMRST